MLTRATTGLAMLAQLAPAGGEQPEGEVEEAGIGRIQLDLAELDFGTVTAGETTSREVGITNIGSAGLFLEDLFVEGSGSFVLDDADLDRILQPGDETRLTVTYAPSAHGESSAVLHVIAGDPRIDPEELPLLGSGLAPMIELDPAEWTFEDLAVGCHQEIAVAIRNVGSAPMELQEVIFAPTSDEMAESHYFGPNSQLAPEEAVEITIYYQPDDTLPDTGYLHVYSNDPAQPDALATQTGTAHLAAEVCDTFEQNGNNFADILWVLDDSCSMYEVQNNLAVNLSAFLDTVEVQNVDYHVAVATTSSAEFGGYEPIMTPGTADVHAAFADAVDVGTGGAATNEGLMNAWDALNPPYTLPGEPNYGFLRDDAKLHVIIVSDGDDESPDTVSAYVAALQGLKDDPSDVHVHAILELPATQYELAVTLTGGELGHLLDPSWSSALTAIEWIGPDFADTFELSDHPVPDTIEVEFNGVPQPSGWAYDSVLNAVVFLPDLVPDDGDVIDICYNRYGGCSD